MRGRKETAMSETVDASRRDLFRAGALALGLGASGPSVGRALGVPAYRLLGKKVRDRAALSWWAIDMPPEDWAAECRDAVKLGYTAFKTKGRPWFDVREQVRQVAAAVPESFKIDIDFND